MKPTQVISFLALNPLAMQNKLQDKSEKIQLEI